MNIPNEQFYWQRFCETGSVDDYLAYRQCVNQRHGRMAVMAAEDEYDADHYGWDRDPRKEYQG